MKIKPKIFPLEKVHYNKDYNYCIYFKVLENRECLLKNNLTKKKKFMFYVQDFPEGSLGLFRLPLSACGQQTFKPVMKFFFWFC
jgi:hypothetical protein